MTALFDQSTEPSRPVLIDATPVDPAAVAPERVVVRPARDTELGIVETLAAPPAKAATPGREPGMLAAVVAIVGGEIIGAAAAYTSPVGGLAARVGVSAGWRGLGVGGFLGRALGRRLNELT